MHYYRCNWYCEIAFEYERLVEGERDTYANNKQADATDRLSEKNWEKTHGQP